MKTIKRTRNRNGMERYTYLGCPLTRNRSPWCYRTCQPDEKGCGVCGRLAPHGIMSRIQTAIVNHKKKEMAEAMVVS